MMLQSNTVNNPILNYGVLSLRFSSPDIGSDSE